MSLTGALVLLALVLVSSHQALRQQLSALQDELRGKESRWASMHARLRQQNDSLRQENTSLKDEVPTQTFSPRDPDPQCLALSGLRKKNSTTSEAPFCFQLAGPNAGEAAPQLLEETYAGERGERNEGEPTSSR